MGPGDSAPRPRPPGPAPAPGHRRLPAISGRVPALGYSAQAQLDLFATARPRRGRVERRGTLLRVSATSLDGTELRKLLKDWYRARAADHVARRIAHYGPRLGVRPRRVSIRDQRLQWGSCSSAGAINLNWRLMLTPGELADYVIVHELCHLRHLDHSARFWALVSEVIPDHQRRRRDLDALQDSLPL